MIINPVLFITDIPLGLSLSKPAGVYPSTCSGRTVFKGRVNKTKVTNIIKIILLFLSLFNLAYADDLLNKIAAQVSNSTLTLGSFQQEKHLKFLKKPLLSTGTFIYDQDKGVLWKTLTPIVSTLLINETQLASEQGEQAIPPAFGRIFKVLLGGELSRLSEDFEVTGTGQQSAWQLQLLPKDQLLKKIISTIRLQGDKEIRSWELQEINGNVTQINFSQISHPQNLSSEQLKGFESVSP